MKTIIVVLTMIFLSACGQQLVEFPKPDVNRLDFGPCPNLKDSKLCPNLIDAKLVDVKLVDVKLVDAKSVDVKLIDAKLVDAKLVDAKLLDKQKIDAKLIDAKLIDQQKIDAKLLDKQKIDAKLLDKQKIDAKVSVDVNACIPAPVALGTAGGFAVLAGSTVTNVGPTSVTGDLGVSPGSAVTGFPPGTVIGTQHVTDPTAATAKGDLTTAYNDAAGRTLCAITVAGNIGGQTLVPGLYKSTSTLAVSSGELTLDAQGNANAVWIFQIASALTVTSGRQVILSGGAKASNIFWQVGTSATLGTTSSFQGTIMADQSITLETSATLNGRALARIAAVTLDSNTIVKP